MVSIKLSSRKCMWNNELWYIVYLVTLNDNTQYEESYLKNESAFMVVDPNKSELVYII